MTQLRVVNLANPKVSPYNQRWNTHCPIPDQSLKATWMGKSNGE